MGEFHARLSASGSKRWMTCPGSVAYSEALGITDSPSKFAAEGTVAHEVHEKCMKSGLNAEDYKGKKFKADGFEFVVNQEMVTHVQTSIDYYRDRIEELELEGYEVTLIVEKFVKLDKFKIKGLDGGTSDVILVWSKGDVVQGIEIGDLKYGAGVAVEADDNSQMMIYGTATLVELDLFGQELPDGVFMTITQPRAFHEKGPIRTAHISGKKLCMWAEGELKPKAKRASESDGSEEDLEASQDGCRFCPASGECPKLLQKTQELTQTDFADVEPQLPDVEKLTAEQKAQVVKHANMLRAFIVAVEKSMTEEMNAGSTDFNDHFKLVRKTTRRKFIDGIDDPDFSPLFDHLSDNQVYENKLKSLTQIEKILKQEHGKDIAAEIMSELTTKPVGDLVVAPITDKRRAVVPEINSDFNNVNS